MKRDSKIYIAGHSGMVGSAIMRKFLTEGHPAIVTRELEELDLTRQESTEEFFAQEKPEYVLIAAARVGGIMANNIYRAEFIYQNLMIEANLIEAAHQHGVKKLIFLGSSCIYPKLAPQPLKEEYLLSDYLEYTNEPYAIAKIAGIKLCESYYRQYGDNYISVMPTNLYGPNDNYNLETSHVLPALIRKFHLAKLLEEGNFGAIRNDLLRYGNSSLGRGSASAGAGAESDEAQSRRILEHFGISGGRALSGKTGAPTGVATVSLWGTGTPFREFLYVDDVADAIYHIMQNVDAPDLYEDGICQINVGMGEDLTIKELAHIAADVVGFQGQISFDATKPDGTPRKLMDISRLQSLGWHHRVGLREGIELAYRWYLDNQNCEQPLGSCNITF